jgi:heme-degrading monooxygenase HmoA
MYVVIAIHHPGPEYLEDYLAYVAGLEALTRGMDGLVEFDSWFDERNQRLIEMSVWESKEDFEENVSVLAQVRQEMERDWSRCSGEVLRRPRPRLRTRRPHPPNGGQARRTRGSSTA